MSRTSVTYWVFVAVVVGGSLIGGVLVQLQEEPPHVLLGAFISLSISFVCALAVLLLWRLSEARWPFAIAGSVTILAIAWLPAELGEWLGSPLTIAFAVAGWLLLLFEVVRWQRERKIALPFLFLVAGLGIVFLRIVYWLVPIGDSRELIRGTASYTKGPTLEVAYRDKLDKLSKKFGDDRPTIVIVAAAGGGIRASYWTSLVLAHVTDRAPTMRDKLFLTSGVSGGSVGLALYNALLASPDARCLKGNEGNALVPCVVEFHSHDFLAGIIGATLTGQVLNVALPVFPRRSVALEQSWEERWERLLAPSGATGATAFRASFHDLWTRNPSVPSMVLNTTSITGGDRLVISNLHTDDWLAARGPCRVNIAEHLKLPLSAAANASARFPYLEDWGWFAVTASADPGKECKEFEGVADGGFFDNYGAATALDAYRRLKAIANDEDVKPNFIIVQITSDPGCALMHFLDERSDRLIECKEMLARRKRAYEPKPLSYLDTGWLTKPIEMFGVSAHNTTLYYKRYFYPLPDPEINPGAFEVAMQARSMSGINQALELRREVVNEGDKYFHFALTGALDAPLGWTLSRHARKQINGLLLETGANQREMDRLVRAVNGDDPDDSDNGLVTIESKNSVAVTVARFEEAIRAMPDWMVFGRIDHAAAAEKYGLKLPPRTVIVFGPPLGGTANLRKAPIASIDMPPKALVWQDDRGKVWLTYNSAYFLEYVYGPTGIPRPSEEVLGAYAKHLRDWAESATR